MRPIERSCLLLVPALLLAACGNSGKSDSTTAAPPRGTLLQSPPELLSTVTAPTLLLELNTATNQQLLSLSGAPVCDILIYHIRYTTVGGANEATTASAALMVPTGAGASCTGARPIVLYAHGTTTDRAFNIANMQNAETLLLAALFASATLTKDSGQLFITGYSQGGYVAMATHRAMQTAGMKVTASVPMSGPYALAAFVDAVFYGEVNGGAPVSSTFLLTADQAAYGNIYASAVEVFEPQYAAGIESLLPSTMLRSQLYAAGKLPQYALFSLTPPAAEFADITPPTAPANLAAVYALGFGNGNLIQNSYRLSYLRDAQTHPDGGFPTLTTGTAAAAPELPWRQALQRNDLRDWIPSAPVLLCGASVDPVVLWLNTQLMQGYWASHALR